MLNETFSRRFQQLDEKFESLPKEYNEYGGSYYPDGSWQQWATSCQNLTKAVYGSDSPHYENLIKAIARCEGSGHRVNVVRGIFLSAKEDFEGGFVFNVELTVSGEIFGDFVVLAKQALSEGHKDVAAVLASAALEDALKRYATANGLNVDGKSMAEVVNALKSRGLVSGAQKSLLDTMPGIRNLAMHAEWSKISEPDVNSVIGFVEQFLLTNFSKV
jgi:hypothetical protein